MLPLSRVPDVGAWVFRSPVALDSAVSRQFRIDVPSVLARSVVVSLTPNSGLTWTVDWSSPSLGGIRVSEFVIERCAPATWFITATGYGVGELDMLLSFALGGAWAADG